MNDYLWEIVASTVRALIACVGHVILASAFIFGLRIVESVLEWTFPGRDVVLVGYINLKLVLEAGDVAVVILLVLASVYEVYRAFRHPKGGHGNSEQPPHGGGNKKRIEPRL